MKFLAKTLIFSFLIFGATQISAQKFGYVSSADLLQMHPKLNEANAELEAFQKAETATLETAAKSFETKYLQFEKDMQEGRLSQIEADKQREILTKEQQDLQQADQTAQFKVAQKREQLIQPILKELDDAIQAVGKEGGYLFIFDTSASGSIIYAEEKDDITNVVKAKLGW
jgi:outer membrane protein